MTSVHRTFSFPNKKIACSIKVGNKRDTFHKKINFGFEKSHQLFLTTELCEITSLKFQSLIPILGQVIVELVRGCQGKKIRKRSFL